MHNIEDERLQTRIAAKNVSIVVVLLGPSTIVLVLVLL
jgi:hypothetical protein